MHSRLHRLGSWTLLGVVSSAGCGARHPSGLAPDLRNAIDAVTTAGDRAAAKVALAELERLLDGVGAELGADDVAPWIAALGWLEQLEAAGWVPRESSRDRSLRIRAALERQAGDGPASPLETALSCWLLRRRDARAAGYTERRLDELVDAKRLDRFAGSASVDAAWTLLVLARIERDEGRHDSALRDLHLAERAVVRRGLARAQQRCFVALERSSCLQTLGRNLEAAEELARAASIAEGDDAGVERAERDRLQRTVGLARLRFESECGLYERALRSAAKLRSQTDGDDIAAQVSYYEAVAWRGRGEEQAADVALSSALASGKLDPKMRGMAWLDRAAVAIGRGEFPDAREALDRHAELLAGAGAGSWPLQAARAGGLRASLLRRTGAGPEQVAKAFELARARYHGFLDAWSTTDDGTAAGVLAFAPRRRLIEEVMELALASAPGDQGTAIAFEEALRARAVGSLARGLGASLPDIETVRLRLTPRSDTGLLVLVPGIEHTHAFAIDGEGLTHERLPNVEELEPLIDAVWREIAAAPQSDLAAARARCDQLVRRLSIAAIPPRVRERIRGWNRCCFVGSDVMKRLPFDLLDLGADSADPDRIGDHVLVSELPSTAVGLALAATPVSPRLTCEVPMLALVAPSADADAARVPVMFDDAAKRRVLEHATGLRWLEGRAAALDALRPTDRALLLFAHGVSDPLRARPSGVSIAKSPLVPTGRLFPDVLDALDLRVPEFCLLASCGVSNTEVKLGSDDSDHLGASLLRRGAKLVLVAAAPLEQTATARLAAVVLTEHARGVSPLSALQIARRALREDPRFDHPHYWATWIPYGFER